MRLYSHTQLQLGFAQATVAAVVALAAVLLARRRQIHPEGEILMAMVRGLVQIIAVGSVLVVLPRSPRWTSGLLSAGMIVAAGATYALSLGIIWIPGLMAGRLLSAARPVNAAVYQFVVVAMIFAASGLTSLVSTLLVRGRVLSPAEQLLLLPGR
jgi:ABC-type iron transport system FetAB permease component